MCVFRSHFNIQLIAPAVLVVSMLACSNALATDEAPVAEEKPPLIDTSNAPAKPPDSVEARIALRQHRESAALNRFTFPGNVLQGVGDHVDNWIVMFCPGWHDKCQGLLPSYELLGVQWENKLNKELVMSSGVRFAKVDCATEKALCVSLDILDYPSVVHYKAGQRVASWESGAPGLVRFVKQQLEPPKKRPVSKKRSAVAKEKAEAAASSCDAAGSLVDKSVESGQHWPSLRSACFALMLLAAVHRVYILLSGMRNAQSSHTAKTTAQSAAQTAGASGSQGAVQRSPLQSCLPQEWAHDRKAIVL